jgi:hypothetical protein
MANRQLRQNVRNLLVGATTTEALEFLAIRTREGDTEVAGYAEEFICELEEDFGDRKDW